MRGDPMGESITGFALWLASEGTPKSPGTIRSYCGAARRLRAYLIERGITSWDQVTRTHIRAWIDSGRSASPPKADTTLAAWHWGAAALFRYLEAEEWDGRHRSPMASMTAPVPKARPVDHLSLPQAKAILAACKGSPRDEAIIRVAADTGLRRAELAGIKAAEVNLGEVTTILVHGKGGRDRYVRLSGKTALALRRYLRQRARHPAAHREALWLGHHGPLTASGIYKIITSRGRQAGLTIHPHQLRHTWAHEFRKAGGPLDDLVVLAGWSGPAMALRYGASAATERALEAAARYSPGDRI